MKSTVLNLEEVGKKLKAMGGSMESSSLSTKTLAEIIEQVAIHAKEAEKETAERRITKVGILSGTLTPRPPGPGGAYWAKEELKPVESMEVKIMKAPAMVSVEAMIKAHAFNIRSVERGEERIRPILLGVLARQISAIADKELEAAVSGMDKSEWGSF